MRIVYLIVSLAALANVSVPKSNLLSVLGLNAGFTDPGERIDPPLTIVGALNTEITAQEGADKVSVICTLYILNGPKFSTVTA